MIGYSATDQPPTLEKMLLISIDGFRHDYQQMYDTSHPDEMAKKKKICELMPLKHSSN